MNCTVYCCEQCTAVNGVLLYINALSSRLQQTHQMKRTLSTKAQSAHNVRLRVKQIYLTEVALADSSEARKAVLRRYILAGKRKTVKHRRYITTPIKCLLQLEQPTRDWLQNGVLLQPDPLHKFLLMVW